MIDRFTLALALFLATCLPAMSQQVPSTPATSRPTQDAATQMISASFTTIARQKAEGLWRNQTSDGFHAAVALGLNEIVKSRLKEDPALGNILIDSTSPLAVAIANDQRATAALLIDSGVKLDLGWFQRTPLSVACTYGKAWALQLLFSHGAQLSNNLEQREWLFTITCNSGTSPNDSQHTLELLLAQMDTVPDPLLERALIAASHDTSLMALVLKHTKNKQPLTSALHDVAIVGPVESVSMLLAAGADPNSLSSRSGLNALQSAAAAGRNDVINFLLANGSDPAIKAANGKNAAMFAADCGHLSTAYIIEAAMH